MENSYMEHVKIFISLMLYFILLTCCTFSHGQSTTNPTRIASGVIYQSGNYESPLLLVSNDNGISWRFVQHISGELSISYRATISAASCSNHFCSAVGGGFEQLPLLVSDSKGQSWSLVQKIYGLPQGARNTLASISCSNKSCIAVGNGPLLIKSDSTGQSWEVKKISGLTPGIRGRLSSISCSNNTCIAVGEYNKNSTTRLPLIVISHDEGLSWELVKDISNLNLDLSTADLEAVHCKNTTCVAAGKYKTERNIEFPLLLASNDSGKSWFVVDTIADIPDMEEGLFKSIQCTDNNCIAVGAYYDKSIIHKLLALSINGGKTWSIASHLPNSPNNDQQSILDAVSCDANLCSVGGIDGNSYYLLVSHDAGNSWKSIENIAGQNRQQFTRFFAVNCIKNVCIVAGTIFNDVGKEPLLAISTDSGDNWSFISDIIDFPTDDVMSVEINSVSNASSARISAT